ncbi:hypothetical protein [Marinicauda sp. Alg238-R41]|uniref:hypothetical protein n=1 Tax=Marinicauda sp. Alg238-R41 TaxID=2993447 RepID=UPI0022E8EB7D|nr:hypothetical protein [Marinicauda sp. Alg238-R41]
MRSKQAVPATREAGFTLIEMLIMLIISGFVATLTIEAIRAASTNAIRVEQAARSVAGELIDERIFRTAVEASRTAYQERPGRFSGDTTGFQSVTAQPVTGYAGEMRPYAVRFEQEAGGVSLIYEEGEATYQLGWWEGVDVGFEYFGTLPQSVDLTGPVLELEREWVDTWPRPDHSTLYYSPLPEAVRIQVRSEGHTSLDMIIAFPADGAPPVRVEDIMGRSIP